MKLTDALSAIHAPQGFTSVMAGLMSGDTAPLHHDAASVATALAEAEQKLTSVRDAQAACTSDWAWWGYNGEIAYWGCVVDLLKAAEAVGADDLPDVPLPNTEGRVVMDAQAEVMRFGSAVRKAAQQRRDWREGA